MSWWMIILLGYLVICWTAWIVIVRAAWSREAESEDDGRALFYRQRPDLYWIAVTLTALVLGPLLPLFLAHCLWAVLREDRACRKFARTYRETTPEPLHPANVPMAGQEHIDRCSPDLIRLGFVPAGTYRLKPEPLPIYAQCLISRAGETVADIALIGDATSVSFVSVLANGHVLETSRCEHPIADDEIDAINRAGRFTAHMIKAASKEEGLEQTYCRHLALLVELELQFGCGTLHLPLSEVLQLKRYENAVFGQVLFGLGKVDNRPQPPQCPIGAAKRVSSVARGGQSAVVLPNAGGAAAAAHLPLA